MQFLENVVFSPTVLSGSAVHAAKHLTHWASTTVKFVDLFFKVYCFNKDLPCKKQAGEWLN